MATGTLPPWLRGFIIPDPRFTLANFDTANSVYTEGGPRPGDITQLDESDLVLDGSGTIAATTNILGKTVRGGHPDGTARYVWMQDGDTLWKGWGPPVNPTGYRFVDRSTTADKWHPSHAVKLADDTVLSVSVKDLRQIVCHVYDADTGVDTEVEVYDPGSAASYDAQPCLLVLPSGRVLCFFWRESGTLSDVRMYYSDDSGATWLPGQKGALPNPYVTASFAPGRLRAVHLRGQIGLFVGIQDTATPRDWIIQFASNDLGATFTTVSSMTGTSRAYHDVAEVGGKVLFAYVSSGAGGYAATNLPYYRTISNVYESIALADATVISTTIDPMEWGVQAGGVYTAGDLTLWKDDDDVVYVAGKDHDTAGGAFYEVMVRRSKDGGSTWSEFGYVTAGSVAAHGVPTTSSNDTATYIRDLSAVSVRGRTWLFHRHEANPGTGDDSIGILYLGGYTSVEPAQYLSEVRDEPDWITGYTHVYLPLDLPNNTGGIWALGTTGAPTASLTALGLRLQTGAGESIDYSTGLLSGTVAEGIEALGELRVGSGSGQLRVRVSDASPIEYEVGALVSTTAISLYDFKAAAAVATVATAAASGSHVQVKINIKGATAKLWYRSVGEYAADPVQDWIEVGSSAALTSAAVNNGHRVWFGQDASNDVYWRLVAYTHDAYAGVGIYGQSNFGDLIGRAYSANPVYVDDGLSIQAADGPTYRNEDWQALPRFDYPVSNLHTLSPREPWRSVDDATQVDLEWTLGGATWPLGALLGVYLGGCNFGFCTLFGRDSGGVWQNLGNLDLRIQTGLKFTRDHRIVRPDTSGGNSCAAYFPVDILAGSRVSLPNAGEGTSIREIMHNSGGTWVAGGSTHNTRILLTSVLGVEATAGTTAQIWSKDGAFIRPITATYSAFRIRIPVQDTKEGYFQIGSFSIGHFHVLAKEPSRGRGEEISPIYELIEPRSAIRRVRRNAPPRRAIDLNFTDAVDASRGTGTNPDPPYIIGWPAAGTAGSVGVRAMTLYDLRGQIERLSGAETGCTYVSGVLPPGSSSTIARVVNRAMMLNGRVMTETWRKDHVLGTEWTSPGEVHRGSTLRIEEEP